MAANATPHPVITDSIALDKLIILDEEPIGSGAFGDVFKARHVDWGCQVAFKKLAVRHMKNTAPHDQSVVQGLKYEAEIHRQLRNVNIVLMLGIVFEKENYGLVLEFVPYGSCDAFIKEVNRITGGPFGVPCDVKLSMAKDVSYGMAYLHTLPVPVVHGDLKLQNILVGYQLKAKITDFGLARWKDYSRSQTRAGLIQGTPSKIPPEKWINTEEPANIKYDTYSYGIVLWEMFSEKVAFNNQTEVIEILRPSLEDEAMQKTISKLLATYHKHMVFDGGSESMLRLHYEKLIECLRRTDRILDSLERKQALTLQEKERVRSQMTPCDWVRCLLDILLQGTADVYKVFLEALDGTGQQHLRLLLEDSDYILDVEHKLILIDNCTFLKDNLIIEESALLHKLLSNGVLDEQEKDSVLAMKTKHEKIELLLQLLRRVSAEQYRQFLNSLTETGQEFVYKKLEASAKRLGGEDDDNADSVTNIASENQAGDRRIYRRQRFNHGMQKASEAKKLDDDKSRMIFTLVHNPKVCYISPVDKDDIRGVATVMDELFLVRQNSQNVEVYDASTFMFICHLSLPEGVHPWGAAGCQRYKCLYIFTWHGRIYRYDPKNNAITEWSAGGVCYGLYITTTYHTVLSTLHQIHRVHEFTTYGSLIRKLVLDSSIVNPQHCIQMSNGTFLVCRDGPTEHRVCLIDSAGHVVKTYGGPKGSDVGQFDVPASLAADKYNRIFVADYFNCRVELLSSDLIHIGYIKMADYQVNRPFVIDFDKSSNRLYVLAERMLVLEPS